MALTPIETVKNYLPALPEIDFTHNELDGFLDTINGVSVLNQHPTASSSGYADSYSSVSIPSELHGGGVLLATLILSNPLVGNLDLKSRRLVVYWPENLTPSAPNTAGVYLKRLTFGTLTDFYSARLYNGGVEDSGTTTWRDIGLFNIGYEGPYFNGDSDPFIYKGELVYPFWDGIPGESTSSFNWYNLATYSPPEIWNTPSNRFYEAGIDRVVLYTEDNDGVAWNGITSIQESPTGGSPQPVYVDGRKISNRLELTDFEATIEAYTAPQEFGVCDGTIQLYNGLFVTQQPRDFFDFTYRTKIGNDVDGTDHGYKIHLVYNALAEPTEVSNQTLSATIEPVSYSWHITTIPEAIVGSKPSAHIVIDSRKATLLQLTTLEDILYGNSIMPPRIPDIAELLEIFE